MFDAFPFDSKSYIGKFKIVEIQNYKIKLQHVKDITNSAINEFKASQISTLGKNYITKPDNFTDFTNNMNIYKIYNFLNK